MAGNNFALYSAVPNVGFGQIATANTAKDGTGTVVTVFTAGSNGSRVEKIRFRAKGTNVATVARIFLNNGGVNSTATNNTLYDEITLSATTLSEVAQLANYEIVLNIPLPPTWTVMITIGTTVAAGYAITCIGGDY